jgi:hypothetical protein
MRTYCFGLCAHLIGMRRQLVSIEIWKNQLFKAWADSDLVGEIKPLQDEVYMFEAPYEYVQLKRYGHLRHAPPHPKNEGKILVPVYHAYRKKPVHNNKTFIPHHQQHGQLHYFGMPFLIPLTPEQAQDPDAVLGSIMEQYHRYALQPSMLFDEDGAEAPAETESGAAGQSDANGIAVGSPKSNGFVKSEEQPGGNDVEMDGGDVKPSYRLTSKAEPNKSLFKLMASSKVPTHSDIPANKVDVDVKELIRLEERTEEEPAAPVVEKVKTIPGGFTEEEEEMYDIPPPAEGAAAAAAPADGPAEPKRRPARVHMGDLLVCEWDIKAARHVFGKQHDDIGNAKWGEFVEAREAGEKEKVQKAPELTLDKLWESFTNEDVLGEDNAWYCSE